MVTKVPRHVFAGIALCQGALVLHPLLVHCERCVITDKLSAVQLWDNELASKLTEGSEGKSWTRFEKIRAVSTARSQGVAKYGLFRLKSGIDGSTAKSRVQIPIFNRARHASSPRSPRSSQRR